MGAARTCLTHGQERPRSLTASTFSAARCRRLHPGGGQMAEEPLHVVFGTGQVGLSPGGPVGRRW